MWKGWFSLFYDEFFFWENGVCDCGSGSEFRCWCYICFRIDSIKFIVICNDSVSGICIRYVRSSFLILLKCRCCY